MQRPTIVDVRRRSEQGVTRPFLCRADDGHWYWVKGRDSGRHSLCAEWLAGRIAERFGLPVAPFRQVVVPGELVNESIVPEIGDLGAGIAFGSRHLEETRDYQVRDIPRTEQRLRATVLFFDWLVRNPDRGLAEQGGNPNLRWGDVEKRLWVIDHNRAFEERWQAAQFFREHVFAADRDWVLGEGWLAFEALANDSMNRLESWLGELPEAWLYLDDDLSVPTGFAQLARDILAGNAARLRREWEHGR